MNEMYVQWYDCFMVKDCWTVPCLRWRNIQLVGTERVPVIIFGEKTHFILLFISRLRMGTIWPKALGIIL